MMKRMEELIIKNTEILERYEQKMTKPNKTEKMETDNEGKSGQRRKRDATRDNIVKGFTDY